MTPGGHGQFIDKTLQLEWYDTWLKGVNTGMDKTDTGMHLFERCEPLVQQRIVACH